MQVSPAESLAATLPRPPPYRREVFTGVSAQQVTPVGLNSPEPGVLVVHVDVGRRAPMVLTAEPDWIDPAEDARHDVVPAHPVDVCIDAVARGAPYRVGNLGGIDEHLGRDASDIQAGATERALLADRRSLSRVAMVENRVARTSSDDREVVGL